MELAPQALGLRTLLVQWLGEGEQDLILGTVLGMKLHQEPPATWLRRWVWPRGEICQTWGIYWEWFGESIGDLKGIIGNLYAMDSSFSRGPKTCKSKAKVPLRAAFRDGVPCGGSRDVWIEKLLEPYACNAEFVVHVASLCAVTWHGLAVKFCREQVPTMGHTTSCRLQTSSNA